MSNLKVETQLNNDTEKKYWFLVSGEVLYTPKDSKEIHAVRLNGVVKSNEDKIPVKGIAKAQEVLQINFYKLVDKEASIQGVVVYAISNLGYMTEKEFNNIPTPSDTETTK